jgi:hypothetical protein
MRILFIISGFFFFASCAQSQGLPAADKKQEKTIDTLGYIYEINKKIDETVLPYIESLKGTNQPAKDWQVMRTKDSTSLVELSQKLKKQEEGSVLLQQQRTEDLNLIAMVNTTLNDAVKESRKGSSNDVLSKLAVLYQSLNIYPNLEEYQKLSSALASYKAVLSSDFKSVTNVQNLLNEFTAQETKFAAYVALKSEADKLKPTLSAYAGKIKLLNADFERYFVLWKNNPVGDRKGYLQERLIEYREYPYLLNLIFNAIDNPEGSNPLKGKL